MKSAPFAASSAASCPHLADGTPSNDRPTQPSSAWHRNYDDDGAWLRVERAGRGILFRRWAGGDDVNRVSDGELRTELTGLCTFLVQGPEFGEGDDVELVFVRDSSGTDGPSEWLPVNARLPDASRDALNESERSLGRQVALIRATLSRTGGFPRDSMNLPSDEHDPRALTLSDVRVLDRYPGPDGSTTPDDRARDGERP